MTQGHSVDISDNNRQINRVYQTSQTYQSGTVSPSRFNAEMQKVYSNGKANTLPVGQTSETANFSQPTSPTLHSSGRYLMFT